MTTSEIKMTNVSQPKCTNRFYSTDSNRLRADKGASGLNEALHYCFGLTIDRVINLRTEQLVIESDNRPSLTARSTFELEIRVARPCAKAVNKHKQNYSSDYF